MSRDSWWRAYAVEPLPPTYGLARDSGHKGPESVPDSSPTLQRTLTWQPQTLDWLWCCSLHACNILRSRLPAPTGYVTCQRAASPVCINRRYRNRVGLRRPYWKEHSRFIVTATRVYAAFSRNRNWPSLGPTFPSPPAKLRSSWSTRNGFGRPPRDCRHASPGRSWAAQ